MCLNLSTYSTSTEIYVPKKAELSIKYIIVYLFQLMHKNQKSILIYDECPALKSVNRYVVFEVCIKFITCDKRFIQG
jgi:hypothetical protein